MPRFHITVHGADREAMADLVRVHDVRVLPQTLDEGGASPRVDALVDEPAIQRLTDAGYRVERHEDVDEAARDDLQQVGQGNRFAAEQVRPSHVRWGRVVSSVKAAFSGRAARARAVSTSATLR